MRQIEPITTNDEEIVRKVKEFLYDKGYKESIVSCDKEISSRVKDFCIDLSEHYWFNVEWYDMRNHLTVKTRIEINHVLELLKCYSKELGITNITRRMFGIIFDARKR